MLPRCPNSRRAGEILQLRQGFTCTYIRRTAAPSPSPPRLRPGSPYYPRRRGPIPRPGEDGYYVAECPSLPGCVSQGKTKEEAIENIKEAIEGYILTLQDDNIPIPVERFDSIMVVV